MVDESEAPVNAQASFPATLSPGTFERCEDYREGITEVLEQRKPVCGGD